MRIPRGHIRCRRRTPPRDSCVPPGPRPTRRQQSSTATWVTVDVLHRAWSARQGREVARQTTTTGWLRRSGTDCRRGGLVAYTRASSPAAAVALRRCSSSLPFLFYTHQTHTTHIVKQGTNPIAMSKAKSQLV